MSVLDYMPAANQQTLSRNPMLPQHPATAAYDSQYAADEAVMRANIVRQYSDILQNLGYTDENGAFIPGSITTNAKRQQADLQRSSDLAAEDVTNTNQRQGTLFSGQRGTQQARAQYPFQQSILDLGINVPLQLSQLYEQAAGLSDQYNLQNNQLMASAAQRASANLTANPPGGGSPTLAPAAPVTTPTTTPTTGGGGGDPTSAPSSDTSAHDLPLPDIAGPSSVWPNIPNAIQNAASAEASLQDPGGTYPNILAALHNAAAAASQKKPVSGYSTAGQLH